MHLSQDEVDWVSPSRLNIGGYSVPDPMRKCKTGQSLPTSHLHLHCPAKTKLRRKQGEFSVHTKYCVRGTLGFNPSCLPRLSQKIQPASLHPGKFSGSPSPQLTGLHPEQAFPKKPPQLTPHLERPFFFFLQINSFGLLFVYCSSIISQISIIIILSQFFLVLPQK